jgi:hypothetical protein
MSSELDWKLDRYRNGLFGALAEAELPVVCVETRHMQAVLKAQINKTDRNDARGIAQMMRVGLYRPVHVKTLRSQTLRMLLTHRKLLQSKAIAIENDLRGTLRNFGLKVGMVGTVKFEARIKKRRGKKKAIVALARRLAVIMHRIWVDGTEFRWTRESTSTRACLRTRSATRKAKTSSMAQSCFWTICGSRRARPRLLPRRRCRLANADPGRNGVRRSVSVCAVRRRSAWSPRGRTRR